MVLKPKYLPHYNFFNNLSNCYQFLYANFEESLNLTSLLFYKSKNVLKNLWTFKLKQIYSEVITGIQKIKNQISRELNISD